MVASTGTSHGRPNNAICVVSSSIISLEMNPPSGGSPAIEAAASVAMTAVTGITLASPPSLRISRVPVS